MNNKIQNIFYMKAKTDRNGNPIINGSWNCAYSIIDFYTAPDKVTVLQSETTEDDHRIEFLQANAKKVERVTTQPNYFYRTDQEMNGKYGWFDSSSKTYNMTEYFSGWEFSTEELYYEFLKIN